MKAYNLLDDKIDDILSLYPNHEAKWVKLNLKVTEAILRSSCG